MDEQFQAFQQRYRLKCVDELARVRSALAADDWSALREAGHRLSGNGGTFGFPDISRDGAALELAVEERDRAAIEAAAAALIRELERTIPRP